jgi:hypothetical protein
VDLEPRVAALEALSKAQAAEIKDLRVLIAGLDGRTVTQAAEIKAIVARITAAGNALNPPTS